jgi:perosamine synthetase
MFEGWLKEFTGASHSLSTSSGTSALQLALAASGVCGGLFKAHADGVIVPTSTFVGTANAVAHVGAIPFFIDSDPVINPEHLRDYIITNTDPGMRDLNQYSVRGRFHKTSGHHITAVVVVHMLGQPADIEGICKVAKEFNLIIIEDASQAIGTRINGKHVGTFGWAGTFSFNNNKILTTNGGGALITNSANIWYDAKQLASTARKPHQWLIEHESMAFNYKMPSICAALGLSQAQEINKILAEKQGLALRYRKALKGMVKFVEPVVECESNYWLNAVLVDNRDKLLKALHDKGIRARASFTPLHLLNFYKYSLGGLYNYQYNVQVEPMAKAIEFFNHAVCLPSGANL